jgi:hypothetical protein
MTMTYSKFLTSSALAAGLAFACVQSANAQTTVNFTTLSSGDGIGSNTLQANGSAADLTVTQSFVGGDFLYAISYSGLDFDGVPGLDTLSFTVRVDAYANGTVVNSGLGTSSAAIGANPRDVLLSTGAGNPGAWGTGGDSLVTSTSLGFSVESLTVSSGVAQFDGFSRVLIDESRSLGHQIVVGEGTGLDGYTFNADKDITLNPVANPNLYITGAVSGAAGAVGVGNIDFSVTVIPEPATIGMLGLGALLTLAVRRLKM